LLCSAAIVGPSTNDHAWPVTSAWVAQRFLIMPHAELASTLVDPPARPPRV
jgi:hypothetical protein